MTTSPEVTYGFRSCVLRAVDVTVFARNGTRRGAETEGEEETLALALGVGGDGQSHVSGVQDVRRHVVQ